MPDSAVVFFELYASKFCDLAMRCQVFATRDECRANIELRFAYPRFPSADKGYETMDRDEAATCLRNLDEMTCRTFGFTGCYYPTLLEPKSRVGEACRVTEDCAEGVCAGIGCQRTCAANLPAGTACLGTRRNCGIDSSCVAGKCQVNPSDGQPCPNGACDHLSTCSSGTCILRDTTGQSCVVFPCRLSFCDDSNKCESYKADGARCGFPRECKNHECSITSGMCLPTPKEAVPGPGKPCNSSLKCGVGYQCQYTQRSSPLASGVCVLPRPGDACLSGDTCPARTTCGSNKTCVPSKAGDACSRDFNCPEGLECLNDTCGSPIAVASACMGYDCVDGSFCQDGRCRLTATVGGNCSAVSDCQEGLACISGKCRAVPVGGACFDSCTGGLICRADPATNYSCQLPAADGQPCYRSTDCQSQACVASVCVSSCL